MQATLRFTRKLLRKTMHDVLVLFEHPDWQKPLFSALERRGLSFSAFDLKAAAFDPSDVPSARLVFNQASPSAYLRGHARAVPLALAYLKALEHGNVPVINGARAFAFELSKTSQNALLRRLNLSTPRSVAFNDVDALASRLRGASWKWPALLKPEQGGSGARMAHVASLEDVRGLFAGRPSLWEPDGLFLLQEIVEHDVERGSVRMEFLGGDLLYAMHVVSHGRFNLCPSPACNPEDGAGSCAVEPETAPPVEFRLYRDLPASAATAGRRVLEAAGIDLGGIEYIEASNGELVFYDVNANSNLRPAMGRELGFDPFDRVVDYLNRRLQSRTS